MTETSISTRLAEYAHRVTPEKRASDPYEACGQAAKSAKWTSLETLVKHLLKRESATAGAGIRDSCAAQLGSS